ncbi:MAG: RAMP superfamily CRISPR-associated protein [Thermodesulfovibrio sp.]|nr:RAMP superfamily CRISPR-associated protein [Thermodesulfovibrio sp.]
MRTGFLILKGEIELISPAIVGSGKSDTADLEVIKDSNGVPYIPATSFAGVLRHKIKNFNIPRKTLEKIWGLSVALSHQDLRQSSIIISDLLPKGTPSLSIRDGVKIDRKRGIAEDKAKFDYEVVDAGALFDLKIEVPLNGEDDELKKRLLSTYVEMLKNDLIRVGAKTNSGFGKIRLKDYKFYHFNFKEKDHVIAWFRYLKTNELPNTQELTIEPIPFNEKKFELTAYFTIKNSLIVRDYSIDPNSPDMVHIKSNKKPVLPGTSIKGAIRARAERIVKTLGIENSVIEDLFGDAGKDVSEPKRGRISIDETYIDGYTEEVQTRIKIDRFTGGTIEGALFETKPLFSTKEEREFQIKITIQDYKDHEVGLILLVLKDLFTGDLPIGGEKSIGRGVLSGKRVSLLIDGEKIDFTKPEELSKEKIEKLQRYVSELNKMGGK